ncbi:hypothetical protein Zmor_018213 [Zophobas morio]|uniref:Uncharacterized protein n=1 Tax=Zophobas morio TaxID=2755281 RepID=A0AA38IA31_9CUCU|nr:hypothetical protein Zmor_018213 [Zophobas morio]
MEDKEQAQLKKKNLKVHPRAKANCLSHFFFCWEIPVILKGWKKELNEDDLYAPLHEYESKRLGDKLEQLWEEDMHFRKSPNLWRCLIKQFAAEFMFYGILYAPIQLAVTLLLPYFLRKLLGYYTPNQKEMTQDQAYIYAGGLSIVACARVLLFHFFYFGTTVIGMKVRVACSSLIYRHALNMKKSAMEKITLGQLINILSNDVNRFDQAAPNLHFIWIAVVELIVGIYYLDATLGHAALGGIAIICLCLALQVFSMFKISKSRLKVAEKTDYRIRLMNDIICGIEAIKMYTWEKPFAKLVEIARRLELAEIKTGSHYRLFINTFKIYMGKFCVFLSVLVAVLTYFPLTSQYAFALICIYESFKFTVIVFLPLGAIMFAETIISVQRIEEFLLIDYKKPSNLVKCITASDKQMDICVLKSHQNHAKRTPEVSLKNVYVKWNESYTNYVLDNINFRASPGDLIGIIGRAGSGKSTLLQVILKEIDINRGKLKTEGTVSYASQEAWIFPTSVRQNILFGQDMDLARYSKIIQVCALERDLTLFPYGDQTLVGDRGVMLSGGQKARINLARAVYRDADIYLLDDPLSAVDAHVARHIYDECITGFLKDKCVILVTHQTHYLQKADQIYQLESGKVVSKGDYKEVIGSVSNNFTDSVSSEATTVTLVQHGLREEVKEHRGSGTANAKVYKGYCLAAGHWTFCFVVALFFVFGQICTSLLDCFLTFWTNVEQKSVTNLSSFFTTENCLYIYIGLMILTVFSNHLATYTFTAFCIKASQQLHTKMLSKIVYGPMTFFNHHPSGRLLNRFSKDLGSIDELLPLHLMNGITVVLTGLAILIIIIVLNYWMIFPSLILLGLTITFIIIFQPTNRNIKRTEGITRSSVLTHMSTSLQGLVTIRAHNTQGKLIEEFDNYQNIHSSAYYLFTATFASFGFWADFMAVVYTVLAVFSFFLVKSETHAGNVGLAITQSINLLGMVQYGVKTFGELDSQMTSVERIVEYAELDPEPDNGTTTPPDTWPTSGKLTFRTVSLQYSPDDPPVLKQVTFESQAGEKIGIIGRTGAGKSSLISVLFRLFDFDGSIIIDNVETKSIPLQNTRSKISIIPQEPILFLGSLRKNIDPFDEYSDSQIWSALEELELKQMISNLPSGLESLVTERGSNFSVGERQLLCLVRAMLRNNKIIVLDEATANVDLKTDELIQSIIRRKFRDCTVLTIAHRLNTIIDSDKILAMDGGKVVEFDHPYKLLQNQNGFFYGFVVKNGDKMLKDFIKIAKNSATKKGLIQKHRDSIEQ